jgi:outer membrane protein OmpA-like peptidoglycan-associated protein
MAREIIGLLSIGIGVVLLILSLSLTLRRIRARSQTTVGRAALATVIYGLLFIFVGVVIHYTEPPERRAGQMETSPPVAIRPPDTVRTTPKQVIADTTQLTERIQKIESQRHWVEKEPKAPRHALHPEEPIQRAPSRLSPEDRIYATVDAVLREIEEFFERYGTPVEMPSSSASSLKLQPLFFDDSSAEIPSKYFPLLDEMARRIKQSAGTEVIEVRAYTDGEGPEVYNFLITQSRANAVCEYLVTRGVQPDRLVAKGCGTAMPSATALDSSERHPSRRIEFVPLSETRTVQK